jgi:hypothetical protein
MQSETRSERCSPLQATECSLQLPGPWNVYLNFSLAEASRRGADGSQRDSPVVVVARSRSFRPHQWKQVCERSGTHPGCPDSVFSKKLQSAGVYYTDPPSHRTGIPEKVLPGKIKDGIPSPMLAQTEYTTISCATKSASSRNRLSPQSHIAIICTDFVRSH